MVKPIYIPSDPNQTTLVAGLHLSKVAQISVEAGEGDELMIFDHALQPSEIISLCTRNAPPRIHDGP